jgi:starch phosphorylase
MVRKRRGSLSRGELKVRKSESGNSLSGVAGKSLSMERPMLEGIKSSSNPASNKLLHELMSTYQDDDKESIQKSVVQHLELSLAKTRFNLEPDSCYKALSMSIRDRLIEYWNDTQQQITKENPKRAYYLSIEYLMGRALQNALLNMGIEETVKNALFELGVTAEECYEMENDAGLGNGGLGRLAACFLDSMATLDLPVWGYGLRYNYGIFKQKIIDGHQVEVPDYWLSKGNVWEIERSDVQYPIKFYGYVRKTKENGKDISKWEDGEVITARAYDFPIPGFDTFNTINLRLWRSLPNEEFDFKSFNMGDYENALKSRQRAEYITSVLYPNDSTDQGKELRLKQQYFFVSASIQDIIRRYKKSNKGWDDLPNKVAIQLNDTHPAMAIVELLRILIDIECLDIEYAFGLIFKVFSYTNHTILPEALEKWGVDLLGHLLPRHLELIYS